MLLCTYLLSLERKATVGPPLTSGLTYPEALVRELAVTDLPLATKATARTAQRAKRDLKFIVLVGFYLAVFTSCTLKFVL